MDEGSKHPARNSLALSVVAVTLTASLGFGAGTLAHATLPDDPALDTQEVAKPDETAPAPVVFDTTPTVPTPTARPTTPAARPTPTVAPTPAPVVERPTPTVAPTPARLTPVVRRRIVTRVRTRTS